MSHQAVLGARIHPNYDPGAIIWTQGGGHGRRWPNLQQQGHGGAGGGGRWFGGGIGAEHGAAMAEYARMRCVAYLDIPAVARYWRPVCDIVETAQAYVLLVELPG